MTNAAQFFQSDLELAEELFYKECGFEISNLKLHLESTEYGACTFNLGNHRIEYRVSKITPTKIGQFVTIWKRNNEGITAPFDISDDVDFIIINSREGDNVGQFIFPKYILVEKRILSQNGKDGKRGIRVYPPWDITTNKQAQKTQSWQLEYFVTSVKSESNLKLVKRILQYDKN